MLSCDIAVIGGSFGGVAAALAAAEAGYQVILSEATDWLGGQVTSQGVAPLDEHPHIETFGGTRRYNAFREGVRRYYRMRYGAPATMEDGGPLNPGNGWVSRLCFEPRVGLGMLNEMLAPFLASGQLKVLLEHRPVAAEVADDRVKTVTLTDQAGERVMVEASYFLDATDLGDLLPLTGTDYVTGAEAKDDTGEPHARREGPGLDEVQSFTYSFALEYRPGEDHRISKPAGYEHFRVRQPYSLCLDQGTPRERQFRMFDRGPEGELPFWTYRRIFDADLLRDPGRPFDLALVNWTGNDYRFATLIDRPPAEQARILDDARQLALGFLYWLQTEVPRDDGGAGYPEFKLRPDVMGSPDGLSKAPYIRESRRIKALERIVETDIVKTPGKGARARPFAGAVGIGWYQMDLHHCVGNETFTMFAPTLPFQIPLGALIPRRTANLLAACKNIGTTHLTNGAYRLQPVEWAVGEAAGTLAALCLATGRTPQDVWRGGALLRQLQRTLLQGGAPLAWTVDVPPGHPLFTAAQLLMLDWAIPPESPRHARLELGLDEPLSDRELTTLRQAASGSLSSLPGEGAVRAGMTMRSFLQSFDGDLARAR